MAFKTWQTGVHIQQDKVIAVALTRERAGWRLRRWWAVPLSDGVMGEGKILKPEQLVNALRGWRKTLPHSHRVFLSFPATPREETAVAPPARKNPASPTHTRGGGPK